MATIAEEKIDEAINPEELEQDETKKETKKIHLDKYEKDIFEKAYQGMSQDADIINVKRLATALIPLLKNCDITPGDTDGYTRELMYQFITYPGGDIAQVDGWQIDCSAEHCMDAVEGYVLRLRDNENTNQLIDYMLQSIKINAKDPQAEIDALKKVHII